MFNQAARDARWRDHRPHLASGTASERASEWMSHEGEWWTPEPLTGCWLWMRACFVTGYGRIVIARKLLLAHRVAYQLLRGPIPAGLQIDHLCRQRSCVNPAHMEAVTQRVNILRGTGMSARHAAQTHCVRGHEFSPDNLYRITTRPNARVCRRCVLDRQAARRS